MHVVDSFGLADAMRGEDQRAASFFSYVSLEQRIPADHPLRPIRELVDEALRSLSPAFNKLYARDGRPSIPPERLLRALLLQAFYTVRSERLLMQQLDYNLLFRWFVVLSVDDPVWDATVFCKNRDRLLDGDIAAKFMTSVLNLPQVRGPARAACPPATARSRRPGGRALRRSRSRSRSRSPPSDYLCVTAVR